MLNGNDSVGEERSLGCLETSLVIDINRHKWNNGVVPVDMRQMLRG